MRIAFVTQSAAAAVSEDDALAVAALTTLGVAVEAVPWGLETIDWNGFAAVVLRSCWDYYRRSDDFVSWLQALVRRSVVVVNPPEVVFATIDKTYLTRLAAAGWPVVPSVHIPRCSQSELTRALQNLGSAEWIVKPTLSAEGYGVFRGHGLDASTLWPRMAPTLAERSVLVQPFRSTISSYGELSLVYFRGQFSHAVRKCPAPGDFRVQSAFAGTATPITPLPACIALGADLLAEPWINRPPYARVDLVPSAAGWEIMELELIEPRLYFGACSAAAGRFASVLRDHIRASSGAATASNRGNQPECLDALV